MIGKSNHLSCYTNCYYKIGFILFCNHSGIYKRFLSALGMTMLLSYQGWRLRRPPFLQLKVRVIPNVERNLWNYSGILYFIPIVMIK